MENEKTEKELEIESVESQVRNAKLHRENIVRELEGAKKQIPEVQIRIDMLKEESELAKLNDVIVQKHFVLKEFKWDFEEQPEYISNLKKINALSAKRRDMQNGENMDKLVKAIEMLTKQIDGYEEELLRMDEKIEVLEKGE